MRKSGIVMGLIGLLLAARVIWAVVGQETATHPAVLVSDDGVSVTIYNRGTALVQDRRTFDFAAGLNTLNFTDVAALIDATSVSFRSLSDPGGTAVLEQNYVYDLVNSDALMRRYIDQIIEVTAQSSSGEPQVYIGQLLSSRGGEIILRQENGEVVTIRAGYIRDVRFPDLPDGLITRPTLRWLVSSLQSGANQVELTYLTGGMTWTADYILLLATDNQSLDLNGWVTLNNTSGTAYHDAQLKLVAGEVNRIQPQPQPVGGVFPTATALAMATQPPNVQQREFFEYQLYEVQRPVTIGDNETKQVEFVMGADIPAHTFYVYESSVFYGYGYVIQDQYYGQTGVKDVQNWLEFSTGEEDGLGADLPAGRVRVYQEDVDGAALLIGENRIDHTPEGGAVRLYLGNAFDLVGERTQTQFERVTDTILRETYEIKLRNRKDDETVEIRVPEHLFRWSDWVIQEASLEYTRLDSATIEFRVQVPPGEERVITYTVQYRWG